MDAAQTAQVGQGIISGGWVYVWAVYGITWLGLLGYIVSLGVRLRSEARRALDSGPAGRVE